MGNQELAKSTLQLVMKGGVGDGYSGSEGVGALAPYPVVGLLQQLGLNLHYRDP